MIGLVIFGLVTSATTYHVSLTGNDASPGSLSEPVKSIAQGIKLASAGDVVLIHEGEYRITEPIFIGKVRSRLLIKAVGKVVLRGSVSVGKSTIHSPDSDLERRLTQKAFNNVKQVDLKDLGISEIDDLISRGFTHKEAMAPVELFVGKEAQTLARWPNEGYFRTGKVTATGSIPRDGDESGKKPKFEFPAGRIRQWTTIKDVWAYGYWRWDWADESIAVESYRDGQFTLAGPHVYGVVAGRPFYFENVLEELDMPGEYYIDRERMRLIYWPSKEGSVQLSLYKKPMLRIVEAANVTVDGLRFETSREFPVEIIEGRNVVIRNCVFRNLGRHAIKIWSGVLHRVEQCRFIDLGEGAVTLSGGDRNLLIPAGHEVVDSHFKNFSRRTKTYRPGVSVSGVGMRVARCEFEDAPHSAIIFGGNNHTFERNYFHDILTHTGDGGAIYGGRDWSARGTVIKENLFYKLHGEHIYENGVYLDDQLSGIRVLDNVFLDCFWGLMIGGGRDNVVKGNLFVDNYRAMHLDARGLGWAANGFVNLKNVLNRVPFNSTTWKRHYPGIENILNDDPMTPKDNLVTNNVLVRAGKDTDSLAPQFKSGSDVSQNLSTDSKAVFTVSNGILSLDLAAKKLLTDIKDFNSPDGRKFGPTANLPVVD